MLRLLTIFTLMFCLFVTLQLNADTTKKHAVPTAEEQKEMLGLVKELYADRMGKDADYAALVEDAIKTANSTSSSAEKYALLQFAVEIFANADAPGLYMQIVEAADTSFENADELWLKGFVTRKVSKENAGEAHDVYGS